MTLRTRIKRVEQKSGITERPIVFLWIKDGETKEAAWSRQHPGERLPNEREADFVTISWLTESDEGG